MIRPNNTGLLSCHISVQYYNYRLMCLVSVFDFVTDVVFCI